MAVADEKDLHPLVKAFFKMRLIRKAIREDGNGNLYVIEIRQDPRSEEKQKFTYSLDTHERT